MVGLQTLDLAIGVRVPASQPTQPFAGTHKKGKSHAPQFKTINIYSLDRFSPRYKSGFARL